MNIQIDESAILAQANKAVMDGVTAGLAECIPAYAKATSSAIVAAITPFVYNAIEEAMANTLARIVAATQTGGRYESEEATNARIRAIVAQWRGAKEAARG